MKIYLDDERETPEGYVRVYLVDGLITYMNSMAKDIEEISLDHDLGENTPTGYDFLKWLEEKVFHCRNFPVPKLVIHSANGVGRQNMQRAIDSILKMKFEYSTLDMPND